ncbi:alpha/beta hydrolase [Rhizobium grahamii]|uniref:Alpha/beta hydrolase n=1 Tax=Rhizobium grahamii TaxID=1120045 RepID=A0A370KE20_9HYPH|nr:alpha/beta hydrolase [Rhizobium grahamii]RDJ01860.1 alpha/beta hydrolase [Rhizobium grahamii]
MPKITELTFFSEGLKLKGLLYEPDDLKPGEKRPTVVCCHGYTGMKDVYLLPVPERLAVHGYVAFAFDHRGFGKSEGVRARLIPPEQVEDIRNAITFVSTLPSVDTDRIALYGTSFGGGNVVVATATDDRVRCVVSVVPVGNGERWLKSLRKHWEWLKFQDVLAEDRRQRVLTGESRRVDVTELMPGDPHSRQVIQEKVKAAETYTQGYPLENAEATLRWKPEDFAHAIAPRPILFMHTECDGLVPIDECYALHSKAKEPKKLVTIPNADHYDVYQFVNPDVFEKVIAESIKWYDRYLKADAPQERIAEIA